MGEDLITTTELCEWFKVSNTTVMRWRRDGMPYIGAGKSLRYKKSEVLAWLKSRMDAKSKQ